MILCTAANLKGYVEHLERITNERVIVSDIQTLTSNEKDQIEIILSYGNYEDELFEGDLMSLSKLSWIQVLSAGFEQLPLNYLKANKILVTTVKGIHNKLLIV